MAAAVVGISALVAATGCGNQYRPVVSAINPVGPAGQPTKYAVAISNPGTNLSGLLTFVDFSGDTVLSTPSIETNPTYFTITQSGGEGYTVNSQGSFNNFGLGNPTALLSSNIPYTTLAASAGPVSISAISLSGAANTIFVPEAGLNRVAALQSTSGVSLIQELSITNPVYVVGADGTERAYAISQGTGGANGTVAAIEGAPFSISATIPVGNTPIYGVMTPDAKRAFILNKGSGTVSVINVPNNSLDVNMPRIPAAGTLGVNPIWADLSPRTTNTAGNAQLVVLNAGDGTTPGTLSIISIPLCNAAAQPTNPNCSAANPVDAAGFGTVLATATVGINPTMVSILQDGTRAYVVNSGNAAAGVEGSVSVVSLVSGTVIARIPAVSSAAATTDVNTTPGAIYGHPNTIAATTGTPTGKVYVTSSDNRFMTVIRTDTETVQTHISMQGTGVALPANDHPQSPGVVVTAP